jgi:hypothetical protein
MQRRDLQMNTSSSNLSTVKYMAVVNILFDVKLWPNNLVTRIKSSKWSHSHFFVQLPCRYALLQSIYHKVSPRRHAGRGLPRSFSRN